MKKFAWVMSALIGVPGLFAATTVTEPVVVPGDPVRVTYATTGDDAIVTVSFSADGQRVDDAVAANVYGDVNRVVPAGSHTIYWPVSSRLAGTVETVTATITVWPTNDPPDYVSFDLTTGQRRYYTSRQALPLGVEHDAYRTEQIVMRRIPAAGVTWQMGSPGSEIGRVPDKNGSADSASGASEYYHKVTLTKDFYLAVFETTQWQNHLIVNDLSLTECSNRTCWTTRPVDRINFKRLRGHQWKAGDGRKTETDCVVRSAQAMMDAAVDLPTEAQWEYACRAGTTGATWFLNNLPDTTGTAEAYAPYVRYRYNGGSVNGVLFTDLAELATTGATARVGSYLANPWGLYDMLGNVSEYVLDGYRHTDNGDAESWVPDKKSVTDPEGTEKASKWRVRRGGQWREDARWCRAAVRQGVGVKSWDTINALGYGYRFAWHFANPSGLTAANSTYGSIQRPFVAPVTATSQPVALNEAGRTDRALEAIDLERCDAGTWLSAEATITLAPPVFYILIR